MIWEVKESITGGGATITRQILFLPSTGHLQYQNRSIEHYQKFRHYRIAIIRYHVSGTEKSDTIYDILADI